MSPLTRKHLSLLDASNWANPSTLSVEDPKVVRALDVSCINQTTFLLSCGLTFWYQFSKKLLWGVPSRAPLLPNIWAPPEGRAAGGSPLQCPLLGAPKRPTHQPAPAWAPKNLVVLGAQASAGWWVGVWAPPVGGVAREPQQRPLLGAAKRGARVGAPQNDFLGNCYRN